MNDRAKGENGAGESTVYKGKRERERELHHGDLIHNVYRLPQLWECTCGPNQCHN